MSAGVFTTTRYSSNVTGNVHPIRVQPETLALSLGGVANAAPAGPAVKPSAQVGKGKRSIGINARTVTIKFITGTVPPGYKAESPITLPWLQQNAAFTGAVAGTTAVEYLATAAVLIGTSPEITR